MGCQIFIILAHTSPVFVVFYRNYSLNINDFRDGHRHDMWLALENVKVGRLHLAITVVRADGKVIFICSISLFTTMLHFFIYITSNTVEWLFNIPY